MTAERSPPSRFDAAERRGADTHWWSAYTLHSTAPMASAPCDPASTATARQAVLPAQTEIQRAADKALGPRCRAR